MKYCPNCKNQFGDESAVCPHCGVPLAPMANTAPQNEPPMQQQQVPPTQQVRPTQNVPPNYQPAPAFNPYDHTHEFDPRDVADNKIFAITAYILGIIGIILAMIAGKSSPYLQFHIRQSLKLTVTEVLVILFSALLSFTFIVPLAGAICLIIISIVQLICFFQTCSGKSVEAPIVRSFNFLK